MARSFRFPVYQIDFAAVQAGKRLSATKRRIRWRFGFPNEQALAEGRTGTECRGEEHEIVIVWSITSGKRQILMDGREVHFSANRIGLLDFSWTMKGNHVLKTVCHAAPPIQATPGFRQYDLFIDGQSFFNMPKVFELGVKGVSADDNRIPGHPGSYGAMVSPRSVFSEAAGGGYNAYNGPIAGRAPRTQSEDDEVLQQAIKASLQEAKSHLGERTPSVLTNASAETDLLDFGGVEASPAPYAPAPSAPSAYSQAPQAYNPTPQAYNPTPQAYNPEPNYNPAAVHPAHPHGAYGAPSGPAPGHVKSFAPPTPLALPPSTNGYSAPPPISQPGPTTPQAYGAPPPTSSFSNAPAYGAPATDFGAYGSVPPSNYGAPAYGDQFAASGHTVDDPFAPKTPSHNSVANDILKAYAAAPSPGQYQPGKPFPNSNGDAPPHDNSSTPVSSLSMNNLTITEKEEKSQNPFDAAMKKLVNVDRIDEPAQEQLKLTMKKQEESNAKKNKNRSVPLPPAGQKVLGSGATLKDISKVKGAQRVEPVMSPPPGLFNGDAATAGALVVHGQGPPPLQPAGFGVVHMQGRMPSAYYNGTPQFR